MKDETGKVTFDTEEQAVVDKIVQERLSRVKVPEDYEDLKAIDAELQLFGYSGTPKERSQAIKAQREAVAKQKELDDLQSKSNTTGTSPEVLAEIRDAKKEAKEANDKLKAIEAERTAKENAENEKVIKQTAWDKQFNEWQEAYPDVDGEILAKNQRWKDFVEDRHAPLIKLYKDFLKYNGESETEAIKKATSKAIRSTGTGKEANNAGGNYGLTASQMATVDDWNSKTKNAKEKITYQEFSKSVKR